MRQNSLRRDEDFFVQKKEDIDIKATKVDRVQSTLQTFHEIRSKELAVGGGQDKSITLAPYPQHR